jgi:hypothetical protein
LLYDPVERHLAIEKIVTQEGLLVKRRSIIVSDQQDGMAE